MKKTLCIVIASYWNLAGSDSVDAKNHVYISKNCLSLLAQTEFASVLLTKNRENFRNDVWVLTTGKKKAQEFCFARREKQKGVHEQDRTFYEQRNFGLAYCFLGSLTLLGTLIPLTYGENNIEKFGGAVITISAGGNLLSQGCKKIIKSHATPARKLAEGRERWLGDQIGQYVPGMPLTDEEHEYWIMIYKGAMRCLADNNIKFSRTQVKDFIRLPLYRTENKP